MKRFLFLLTLSTFFLSPLLIAGDKFVSHQPEPHTTKLATTSLQPTNSQQATNQQPTATTVQPATISSQPTSLQPALATTQPTISGTLSAMPNRPIKLEGFNGYDPYTIAETTTDDEGNFTLPYDEDYFGMGIMTSGDDTKFIVVLSGEEIRLEGETLAFTESIRITAGNFTQTRKMMLIK